MREGSSVSPAERDIENKPIYIKYLLCYYLGEDIGDNMGLGMVSDKGKNNPPRKVGAIRKLRKLHAGFNIISGLAADCE